MTVNFKNIYCKYPEIYLDEVDGLSLVYTPVNFESTKILNERTSLVFSLINDRRNFDEISKLAKKMNEDLDKAEVKKILVDLIKSKIIYSGRLELPKLSRKLGIKRFTAWLHITNQCNLRCTYCYVEKTGARMDKKMGEKVIRRLIDSAKKHKFKEIRINFSGGECLLEFKLIKHLIDYSKKLGKKSKIKFSFLLLSNGILITKEIAEYTKKNKIMIRISLDGMKKYNDKGRVFSNGKGSFDFIVRGIRIMQKVKASYFVGVTVTDSNVDGLYLLTKFFIKEQIPFSLNLVREHSLTDFTEISNNHKKLIRIFKKVFRYIGRNLDKKVMIVNTFFETLNLLEPNTVVCGAGKSLVAINPQGKLTTCQMSLDRLIGSIDDDIIKTVRDKNIFKPHDLSVLDKKQCRKCMWRYICAGGCPMLVKNTYRRDDVASPNCDIYKALIPEMLKLKAKQIIRYSRKKK